MARGGKSVGHRLYDEGVALRERSSPAWSGEVGGKQKFGRKFDGKHLMTQIVDVLFVFFPEIFDMDIV